ncbi:MAG: hypothetical protein ACREQL_08020 [Candidatus Binatia bacterium]
MRDASRWSGTIWTVVGLALLVESQSQATAACRSTCTEELRICRRGCAEARAPARRSCVQGCRDRSTCAAPGAVIRTVAYTVTQCRQYPQAVSGSERLVVRRGNCDPVTVMELPPVGPIATSYPGCRIYGDYRIGRGALSVMLFQRLGVLADGSGIIVEITDDYAFPLGLSGEPPEEGLFFIRLDGTTQYLGPPVGLPILVPTPVDGSPVYQIQSANFGANPVLRQFAYVGLGPGPTGDDAPQVFVLDPDTGRRTQVTHLPAAASGIRNTCCPFFVDKRTIIFRNGAADGLWTVETDGSGLRPVPGFTAIDGTLVTNFAITAGHGNAFAFRLRGEPVRRYGPLDTIAEIFLVDGKRVLQLTDWGYPDTGTDATLDFGRAVFSSSADPLGENPAGVCQFFSVNLLGSGVRQLTHFPDDGRAKLGCLRIDAGSSCRISALYEDPRTGAVPFVSSCDPLGRNPNGEQLFAMRRDGSGLRQITAFRGVEEPSPGVVQVEMAGSVAFSALIR